MQVVRKAGRGHFWAEIDAAFLRASASRPGQQAVPGIVSDSSASPHGISHAGQAAKAGDIVRRFSGWLLTLAFIGSVFAANSDEGHQVIDGVQSVVHNAALKFWTLVEDERRAKGERQLEESKRTFDERVRYIREHSENDR